MEQSTTITANGESQILSQERLQQLLRTFKEERGASFDLTVLGYFGSYARGEARPESDIDIVFDTARPNLWMTSIMKQDLEGWFNRSVDLIRLHKYLHPTFRARIEREAIYV